MIRYLLASTVLFGCATQFNGSPHIDPGTCQQRCASTQMVMTGMVYMGEYSSACICEVPRAAAPPPAPTTPPSAPAPAVPGAGAAAAAGAAGVVMQMRRASQSSQHQ